MKKHKGSDKPKTKVNELHGAPKEPGQDTDPFVSAAKAKDTDMNQATQEKPETDNQQAKIKELEEKYAELEDKYKRLVADQANMSKRMQREREDAHKYAAVNTIEQILPAIDNFDFAKKSITEETAFGEVIKSIEMLKTQLMMCLTGIGLEEVNVNGKFNPEFHEALSKIKDESKEEDTIIEVIKPGYKFKDKVIRVASVVVSSKD